MMKVIVTTTYNCDGGDGVACADIGGGGVFHGGDLHGGGGHKSNGGGGDFYGDKL